MVKGAKRRKVVDSGDDGANGKEHIVEDVVPERGRDMDIELPERQRTREESAAEASMCLC
jgi:hypothetical protein